MPRVLSNTYVQYRSFDYVYELKNKSEKITFEIFDTKNQSVFKEVIQAPTKESTLAQQTLWKSGNSLVDFARQLENLPKTHMENLVLYSELVEVQWKEVFPRILEKMIKQQKAKIFVEHPDLEKLTCPITLEPFVDPVIDEHGHTFEKSAIEDHLKRNSQCPISREPIKTLSPNRLIKDQVEELRAQDPIPTLGSCKQENLSLAEKTMQMARHFAEAGEFEEAVNTFKKALNYTNRIKDYQELSEIYKQMGEVDKAELAEIFLLKYQLERGQIEQAITTLEKMPHLSVELTYLLAILCLVPNEKWTAQEARDKAVKILIEAAQAHERSPEEVALIYKNALKINPWKLKLYLPYSEHIEDPAKRGNLFFKGSLHALEKGKNEKAMVFFERAEKLVTTTWKDYRPLFMLGRLGEKGLKKLIHSFEVNQQYEDMLKAAKYLCKHEPLAENAEFVIRVYQALENWEEQLEWIHKCIQAYFDEGENERAALHTREWLKLFPKDIDLLKWVDETYDETKDKEIEEIWDRLGKAYVQNDRLKEAEKIYKKAFSNFHKIKVGFKLANIQEDRGKISASVKTYAQIAEEALLDGNTQNLKNSIERIRAIDPRMENLTKEERMHLLLQSQIIEQSNRIHKLEENLTKEERMNLLLQSQIVEQSEQLSSRVHKLEENLREEKRMHLITQSKIVELSEQLSSQVNMLEENLTKEKRRYFNTQSKIVELSEQLSSRIHQLEFWHAESRVSEIGFGSKDWRIYFGEVGEVPPLPPNIDEILQSPCPFWQGQKVSDTHFLCLIPKTVNGSPLTLDRLGELVKTPKQGSHTQYRFYWEEIQKEYGSKPIENSYWVLMTKDVLPGSRGLSYEVQKTLVEKTAPYEMPRLIEAATVILMYTFKTGGYIYRASYGEQGIWTRCLEKHSETQWPLVIGGLSRAGLGIDQGHLDNVYGGVGGARKFYRAPNW